MVTKIKNPKILVQACTDFITCICCGGKKKKKKKMMCGVHFNVLISTLDIDGGNFLVAFE